MLYLRMFEVWIILRCLPVESAGLKRTANDIYFTRFWHENLIIVRKQDI